MMSHRTFSCQWREKPGTGWSRLPLFGSDPEPRYEMFCYARCAGIVQGPRHGPSHHTKEPDNHCDVQEQLGTASFTVSHMFPESLSTSFCYLTHLGLGHTLQAYGPRPISMILADGMMA